MKKNYKRLIMANFLGFTITNGDGHRWINFNKEVSNYSVGLYNESQSKGVWLLTSKVYGGLEEALDTIDVLLKKLNKNSLLEQFDTDVSIEYDIKHKSDTNLKERVGVLR